MEDSSIGKTVADVSVKSQRRDTRDSLLVLAQLKHENDPGAGADVRVRNVSSGGLMAEVPEDYRPGDRIEVRLEGVGAVTGVVAWAEAGRIGIAFDHPVDKSRARKAKPKPAQAGQELFRPTTLGHKRPPLKTR